LHRVLNKNRHRPVSRAAVAAALWWLVGAAAIIASLALAVTRGAGAADSDLADHRASSSGQPLVFRPVDNMALDRDDQQAASQRQPWPASPGNQTDQPSKQTSVFTEMNLARGQGRARSLQQPVVMAAAEQSDPVPPAPTPDLGPRAETLPGGPRIVQPPAPAYMPGGPHLGDGGQPSGGLPLPPGPQSTPGGGPLGGGWPHDDLRHHFEQPLVGASWENEPYHLDWFLGAMRGTEIIRDRVDQNVGVVGGFRLGWDYDLNWGLETRLGFSSLEDQPEAAPLYGSADKVVLWDTSVLYYPWGDSRCRPYWTLGLGLSEFRFSDEFGNPIRRNLLEMPFGFGLKYRWHDWVTLRADVTDNLAFGSSGLETMNNISFTTGMEFHFGGCHKNYWPWEPEGAR
jgi:hypothetical protein